MGKLVPTLTLLALLVASTHQLYFSPLLNDLGFYRRQDAGFDVVDVGAAVGWAKGEEGGRCEKVGGEEGVGNEGIFSACESTFPSGLLALNYSLATLYRCNHLALHLFSVS